MAMEPWSFQATECRGRGIVGHAVAHAMQTGVHVRHRYPRLSASMCACGSWSRPLEGVSAMLQMTACLG